MSEPGGQPLHDLSKTLYLSKKAFLESWQLQPIEAQVIMEVCNSREYYIDTTRLSKRIQAFEKVQFDLERLLKDLIQRGYVQPYVSKKDEFCVRSDRLGRDFIRMSIDHGFESFDDMPALEERYSRVELMCYDPAQFKIGEVRHASGPNGKITITITDIMPSNHIYGTDRNGRTIYGIRLLATARCPRCGNQGIHIDVSYVTEDCYINHNPFRCDKCDFQIMLRSALDQYYT